MRSKFITIFALMLCVGALFFTGTVHASTGETDTGGKAATEENKKILSVDAVWLDGDTLHINVRDADTGVSQALELDLRKYVDNSEYVSVQAIDRGGNESNVIYFKNPYYNTPTPAVTPVQDNQGTITLAANEPKTDEAVSISPIPDVTAVKDNSKPFTLDGTGTVIDNAGNSDGKEFFSIKSDDGNEFYLIVDRQKTSENVYLLNPVTNEDLAALAKKDGNGIITVTPAVPGYTATVTPEPTFEPSVTPVMEQTVKSGGIDAGSLIFIILAMAGVGGAGYYFKIVLPKRKSDETDDNDEDYDDSDLDDEINDDAEKEDIDDGGGEDID